MKRAKPRTILGQQVDVKPVAILEKLPGGRSVLNARVRPADKVLTKTIDGEIIALSLSSGHYYKLNPTASTIWDLLKKEPEVSKIRAALVARFDAPESQIQEDLLNVLQFLEREELIKLVRE